MVINSTTYTLVYDQGVNGIRIAYNGPGSTFNTTAVKATLTSTATPEPASLVLLGTGLVGVFGAARRRSRRTASAA